jgi:hypothetical protein
MRAITTIATKLKCYQGNFARRADLHPENRSKYLDSLGGGDHDAPASLPRPKLQTREPLTASEVAAATLDFNGHPHMLRHDCCFAPDNARRRLAIALAARRLSAPALSCAVLANPA